jgi:uncharacterized iron-regulated protein
MARLMDHACKNRCIRPHAALINTALALILLCAGLAHAQPHPLQDRIWDTRSQAFISADTLHERAAKSTHVLLGELHDSAIHHRLQLQVLRALDARGLKPALAMEQFDTVHQAALSAAQAAGERDAEKLADAGRLDRRGWSWPLYRDLVAFAGERGWPLIAANLSRNEARDIALGKVTPALSPADATQITALEDALVRGHCGYRPPREQLERLVAAQRARDARMAATLEEAARSTAPVVFITGAGHVHRGHAVPSYLKDGLSLMAIAFIEVDAERSSPQDYALAGFDYAWFTAATPRDAPCRSFARPPSKP